MTLDYTQYLEAKATVIHMKILNDKFIADPEFKKFYGADTSPQSIIKDEQINYDEWKPLALDVYPEASEDNLIEIYETNAGEDAMLSYEEYKEAQIAVNILIGTDKYTLDQSY